MIKKIVIKYLYPELSGCMHEIEHTTSILRDKLIADKMLLDRGKNKGKKSNN